MTIYIDIDYKCHVSDDGSMTAVETDFFDGKCQEYIEGYRYVPPGQEWTRDDGVVFRGEMISPWTSYSALATAQEAYERGQAEADATIAEMVEVVYNIDMEEIENV